MACFVAPMTEAIVSTIVKKACEKKGTDMSVSVAGKLDNLNKLLWGGSALLAFEHVWHGEITPFYPFLTAAASSEATAEMIHEIMTTGVGMALLITAVWGIMTAISVHKSKKITSILAEENA